MKTPILSALILVTAGVLAIAPARLGAQSGENLFQRALVLERSNGAVRQAIDIYEQIVRDFASDRPLVARALIRLGMAHEALGSLEARGAYERVINDFADQGELAAQAQARLAALADEASEVDAEQISRMLFTDAEGCAVYWMRASQDGRRLAWSNICGDGELMVRDVDTGEVRQLSAAGWHGAPVWSRDGTRLMAIKMGEGLRVYDAETGVDRTPDSARDLRLSPVDWSVDGEHIAAVVSDEDGSTSPVIISLVDGDTVRLAEDLHQGANGSRFSPDGRYIVFSDYAGEGIELYVSSIDGSGRTKLTDSGEERIGFPLWSPDGGTLIYQQAGAWHAIPMAGGAPAGGSYPLRAGGSHWPVDWTERGLYHAEENVVAEPLEIPVDPETGRATGPQERLPAAVPGALWMTWSPDMSRLAMADWDNTMRIYSGTSGAVTEFPMGPEFLPSNLWWSADGSEIHFTTFARGRRDKRNTVFALDPQDGSVRELFPRIEDVSRLHLSRDGRRMTFVANLQGPGTQELVVAEVGSRDGIVLDSAQGDENGLPGPEGTFSGRAGQPVFSPDGSQVLYLRFVGGPDYEGEPSSTLWIAAADGASPPRALATTAGGFMVGMFWSPDSRFVAFTEVDTETEQGRLSVIDVETGARHDLLEAFEVSRGGASTSVNLRYWAPDGRSVGFVRSVGKIEVWLTGDILGENEPGGGP